MVGTSKKRKAATADSSDDEQGKSNKKMSKKEKQEARARAREAMTGGGTAAPATKRRKLNSSESASKPKAKSTSKNGSQQPSFVNPPPAAAAASNKKSSSTKKPTKKQAQEEARKRAAAWGAQDKAKRKSGAGSSDSEKDGSESESEEVKAPSPRRMSTGGIRTTSQTGTATQRRRNSTTTAAAAAARAQFERDDAANEMPMPPTRFGGTTSSPAATLVATQVQPQAMGTLPAPIAMHFAASSPTRIDTGVTAPARPNRHTSSLDGKPPVSLNKAHGILLVVLGWLASIALLYSRGCFVYTKSGIFAIVGTTRIPYVRRQEAGKYVVEDENMCYYDSPQFLLTEEIIENAPKLDCSATMKPCPANALCFQGGVVACQGSAWELVDGYQHGDSTPCQLTYAANATYMAVVSLVEEWSIHHLCLNHVEGEQPVSFYAVNGEIDGGELSSDGDNGLVIFGEGGKGVVDASRDPKIPLYSWVAIFRMVEPSDELNWDWNLLEAMNVVHQRLVLDRAKASNAVVIGLTPEAYAEVEATKLDFTCKASRRLRGGLEWLGYFLFSVLIGFLGFLYGFAITHPIVFTVTTLIATGLHYRRQRIKKQQEHVRKVNEIRQIAIDRLKAALHKPPGQGMQKGEVAVMHLRDSIAFELHGEDLTGKRQQFNVEIWPYVCQQIQSDNRIRKLHRPIAGGVRRDIWVWAATEE